MEILKVIALSKYFYLYNPGLHISSCEDISFTLNKGEFLGIIGRSGSGKSTILKCINRTYLASQGSIIYKSEAFGEIDLVQSSEREMIWLRHNEIGYVSQFLQVMPRTTAKEHVKSALLDIGKSDKEATTATETILEYFKLPRNLWNIYPATFSGGERLRLNLAYAMVKRPQLLMLDEPTASLDNESKILVKEMLIKLKQLKTSMIGIFHDIEFMDGVCDKVINIGQGRII